MAYYVYLLASDRNGTLYIGVTNDLVRRVYEHKNKILRGFTSQYGVGRLVWFETTTILSMPLRAKRRQKMASGLEIATN